MVAYAVKGENPTEHAPSKDDTLESIAASNVCEPNTPWQALALFNFGTTEPREVNRGLIEIVGAYDIDETNPEKTKIDPDLGTTKKLKIPKKWSATGIEAEKTHTVKVKRILPPPAVSIEKLDKWFIPDAEACDVEYFLEGVAERVTAVDFDVYGSNYCKATAATEGEFHKYTFAESKVPVLQRRAVEGPSPRAKKTISDWKGEADPTEGVLKKRPNKKRFVNVACSPYTVVMRAYKDDGDKDAKVTLQAFWPKWKPPVSLGAKPAIDDASLVVKWKVEGTDTLKHGQLLVTDRDGALVFRKPLAAADLAKDSDKSCDLADGGSEPFFLGGKKKDDLDPAKMPYRVQLQAHSALDEDNGVAVAAMHTEVRLFVRKGSGTKTDPFEDPTSLKLGIAKFRPETSDPTLASVTWYKLKLAEGGYHPGPVDARTDGSDTFSFNVALKEFKRAVPKNDSAPFARLASDGAMDGDTQAALARLGAESRTMFANSDRSACSLTQAQTLIGDKTKSLVVWADDRHYYTSGATIAGIAMGDYRGGMSIGDGRVDKDATSIMRPWLPFEVSIPLLSKGKDLEPDEDPPTVTDAMRAATGPLRVDWYVDEIGPDVSVIPARPTNNEVTAATEAKDAYVDLCPKIKLAYDSASLAQKSATEAVTKSAEAKSKIAEAKVASDNAPTHCQTALTKATEARDAIVSALHWVTQMESNQGVVGSYNSARDLVDNALSASVVAATTARDTAATSGDAATLAEAAAGVAKTKSDSASSESDTTKTRCDTAKQKADNEASLQPARARVDTATNRAETAKNDAATAKNDTNTAKGDATTAKNDTSDCKTKAAQAFAAADAAKSAGTVSGKTYDVAKGLLTAMRVEADKAVQRWAAAKSAADTAKSSVDTAKGTLDTAKASVDTAKNAIKLTVDALVSAYNDSTPEMSAAKAHHETVSNNARDHRARKWASETLGENGKGTKVNNKLYTNCPEAEGGARPASIDAYYKSVFGIGKDDALRPWLSLDDTTEKVAMVAAHDDLGQDEAAVFEAHLGKAGVYFRPSRVAGDGYRVRAALSFKEVPGGASHPNREVLLARYAALPQVVSAGMRVWRRASFRGYVGWTKNAPIADWDTTLDGVRAIYAQAHVHFVHEGAASAQSYSVGATITAPEYETLVDNKLNASGPYAGKDAQYTAGYVWPYLHLAHYGVKWRVEDLTAFVNWLYGTIEETSWDKYSNELIHKLIEKIEKTTGRLKGHTVAEFEASPPILVIEYKCDQVGCASLVTEIANDPGGGDSFNHKGSAITYTKRVEGKDCANKATHGGVGSYVYSRHRVIDAIPLCAIGRSLGGCWQYVPRSVETWAHEVGHHRHMQHARAYAGKNVAAPGGQVAQHDSQDNDLQNDLGISNFQKCWDRLCIMSYDKTRKRMFCGKCLFKNRGWRVEALANPAKDVVND